MGKDQIQKIAVSPEARTLNRAATALRVQLEKRKKICIAHLYTLKRTLVVIIAMQN